MKKILLLLLALPLFTFGQTYEPTSNGEYVKHTYFSLSYIEQYEQPEWVFYHLTTSMINGVAVRSNNFRSDPKVSTLSSTTNDYLSSGYDRGHLAPAGDMKLSKTAMSESFYMSNISPQTPSFNRGGWKKLEALVRNWVLKDGDMYIVTGAIFTDNKGYIGSNNVCIPSQYYKIVYSQSKNKMIGFVLPNQNLESSLISYVTSIDYIETLSGIDFFHQLDDELENSLEHQKQLSNWDFKISSTISQKRNPSVSSLLCQGITEIENTQCMNKTKNSNSYCSLHKNQSTNYNTPQTINYTGNCTSTTNAGTRCKRTASSGAKHCWQHQ